MLAGLLADSHLTPFELLPARITAHARAAGLGDVRIHLGDLQRRVLRLLTGGGPGAGHDEESPEWELTVEGSVAGRAYQYGHIVPLSSGEDGCHPCWVPLLNGTERLGVMRVTSQDDDERAREDMLALAGLVAMLVVGGRDTSDHHARLTRSSPMNVAAEMQWQLMPPRTYADGRVVIGAVMEPAYQVSGDASTTAPPTTSCTCPSSTPWATTRQPV
ncbi:Stage II sporulation E family protein OS=Streptomyces glaucescens OX=1907 GN=SGLAU_29455 PE=4 SV=1 [Streptomyces glaucescens]